MKFRFNPRFPDATEEQKWEQIRLWRDSELLASDWTQLQDSPVDKEAWAIYRQKLRDLPAQNVKAEETELPLSP